jgi:hypothetical protein
MHRLIAKPFFHKEQAMLFNQKTIDTPLAMEQLDATLLAVVSGGSSAILPPPPPLSAPAGTDRLIPFPD